MLEGTLELTRGDETLVLGVGESAIVPRGMVHTFRNPGASGARVLSVFSPAGFERFFEDFGTASEGEMSLSGPPVERDVIERVLATSREYGMVIPGAPG